MTSAPVPGLFDPDLRANPYPAYAELRAQDPVHAVDFGDGSRVWLVTRHADVEAIFKDRRFVKDVRVAGYRPGLEEELEGIQGLGLGTRDLLSVDPPDHTRLRRLVQQAFTPRLVESLRDRVQQIADHLLDGVEVRGSRRFDLIDDYAFPLPITVICELLGVPSEDRQRFRQWSNELTTIDGTAAREQADDVLRTFAAYLQALFDDKRAHPGQDLVTGLVQAEDAGDRLDAEELLGMVLLLLIAGHETTVNLIGNGTLALLRHPDQLARLQADPSLISSAIEELLRYDGPVETATERYANEDVEIGGARIRRGDTVLLVIASADRDGTRFPDPDRLDITRGENRHLAFGRGIHHCLGAPLARLEGQIAIGTLLRRMPDLRLAVPANQLRWRPGILIRGLDGLPVTF